MRRLVIIVSLGMSACHPSRIEQPSSAPTIVMSPDPELEGYVEKASVEWSNATGSNVVIGAGGVLWRIVDPVELPKASAGRDLFAYVDVSTYSVVEVSTATFEPSFRSHEASNEFRETTFMMPVDADLIVKHEMCHVLSRTGHLDEGGICATSGGDGTIHRFDLEHVCIEMDCGRLRPEKE